MSLNERAGYPKLIEGKTKIIWKTDHPDHVLIESKDDITAGDGARRDLLTDKGILATSTTVNTFRALRREGIATHFIDQVDDRTFKALKTRMIPIEIVNRRIATGSYLKRNPNIQEGTIFDPLKVEYFLKDDKLHDPLMVHDFVRRKLLLFDPRLPLSQGLIEERSIPSVEFAEDKQFHELMRLRSAAEHTFLTLEQAWKKQKVALVDLKVELGYAPNGVLVVADVIDNDSWRIWPAGDKNKMKDKQVYRNLTHTTPEALGQIKENYAWVAKATSRF
jgi:phosphoribosylaminoimidazole-succinocarboxamide synthase